MLHAFAAASKPTRWCAAALFALLAAAGCARPDRPRDTILITLDTLRADRLGCLGAPQARTPQLDRWARRGVLVRDCIADVPLTLPSHTSLMTGRNALSHGIRVNGEQRLTEEAETLPERLAASGYATGAVVSSLVLHSKFGLAQGFAFYDDSLKAPYIPQDESRFPNERGWLPQQDRRAPEAVAKAIEWLESRRGQREPIFFWLHLYDAHYPYDPPPPWGRLPLHLYDAEVAALDRDLVPLGRLIESAEARRPLNFMVTSDHGEGLGDHGEDEHGIFVYDETIRVPLFVRAEGLLPRGRLVDGQVRIVDLASTILALCGRPAKGAGESALGEGTADPAFGEGGSLVPFLRGEGPPPSAVAYAEAIQSKLSYSGSGMKAVRTAQEKYIAAARPEFYDLKKDPGERRMEVNAMRDPEAGLNPGTSAGAPVGTSPPATSELAALLEKAVREALAKGTLAEPVAPDEATEEALRSLGYVSSGKAHALPRTFEAEMTFPGFDPKDLVDVVLAGRNLENGFLAEAEQKLDRYFARTKFPLECPDTSPVWSLAHQNAAKAAMTRGFFAKAAGHYEEALRAEPGNGDAAFGMVFAWNLDERPELAEKRGVEILRQHPENERLALHCALAVALQGRTDEARRQLQLLAGRARDAETGGVAALFAEKLATPEEGREYLRLYLSSEGPPRLP